MALVVESENTMKEKFDEIERKLHEKEKQLQDKEKELECRIIPSSTESSEKTIVQDMSQVSLKYLQLTGSKNQNKNLENLKFQREQERKTWEAKSQAKETKSQEFQTKNDKLMKQVTGQLPVQGKTHIIWHSITEEANKLRPCLDFVLDKEVAFQLSKKIVTTTRDKLK